MIKRHNLTLVGKKKLALVISLFITTQAQGFEFYLGEIEGNFDSQLSVGSSWRVESQDPALLSDINGQASNNDDSNNNYQDGDAFSQLFKGSHDLQFNYQNIGSLTSIKYWYDSALANNNVDYGHGPSAEVGGASGTALDYSENSRLNDSDFHDLSKASGVALMDAFIYVDLEVLDSPVDMRLGRQVVSWGESTFIPGGINAINPIDVNALRRPGSEIKEALLPVNMAYTNVGLTENLSAEAFYQLEFEGHVTPGCGTYFSLVDSTAEGCNSITIANGAMSVARREENGMRLAKDDGQFGVAFRFISEALGDTEFGIYAMNIHSRAPSVSFTKNNIDEVQLATSIVTDAVTAVATQGQIDIATAVGSGVYSAGSAEHNAALISLQAQMAATQAAVTPNAALAAAAAVTADTNYFLGYEENIQLLGLSFSANVGSMVLSGEVNHKLDMPVQINGSAMVSALLGAHVKDNIEGNENELDLLVAAEEEGAEIEGFRLFDVSQVQMTATQFFDRVVGASRVTFIAEAAMAYVHSLDESSDAIKFGRTGNFGHPDETENDGFVTTRSWGYRTLLEADYNDVYAGINLKPTITWSHDVKGYGAQSGSFKEGQKSLGLSLRAEFLSMYRAELAYTQYSGGKYSLLSDRDFASMSVAVQF